MSIRDEFKKFSSKKSRFAAEYDTIKGALRNKWIPHYKLPEHLYQYQELLDMAIHSVWTARRSFVKLVDVIDYLYDQLDHMIETMDEVCSVVINEVERLEDLEKRKEIAEQGQDKLDLDVNKIIEQVNTEMNKIKDLKKDFEDTLKEIPKE